jgi:ATP-binding cassette subfamily B protein
VFIKNAPIIILDEATASVDPENEHLIQQAISVLTKDKTVEQADNILVVVEGRIIQQGAHNTLISQEGIYRNFIRIKERTEGWHLSV